MNVIRSVFLVFAALVALVGIAGAQYTNALTFANITVSPNPVVAGSNVTIRFQLYNSYNSWLYNVNLQPEGTYPLLNVSPIKGIQIGTLNSGLTGNYFNYTFTVPNSTPSGTYALTFLATYFVYGPSGVVVSSSSLPVNFHVQNNPDVRVLASNPTPSTLYTGYNQTINLVIENDGYGTARNVSVSVHGEQGLNILSSVTTFFVPNLTEGSAATEPVLVAAQGGGSPYIMAGITYYSSDLKQRFSTTQRINLSVAPAAQFSINSSSSSIVPGATDVPAHFTLTNTGNTNAIGLQLSLETPYPITPVASTAYVANLAPGESENLTFLVSVDTQGVPGNYPVTLYEQWKQQNGAPDQQFTGSSNYYIKVGKESTSIYYLIAAMVVAIAIIVAALRMLNKRGRLQFGARRKKAINSNAKK